MSSVCAELVVVVDDNDIDIFINQKVLEFSHFTKNLLTYTTGREALNYLSTATDKDIPDLIFLDLNMPVIDGFGFLHEFSKLSVDLRKKTRIVVLSSSNNMRDMEKIGVEPGVIKFLSKPLTEDKLNQVRQLLEGYKKKELRSADELSG